MTWEERTKCNILNQVEGVNKKDLLFFRIEEFWRNIERIESLSTQCPDCKRLLTKAEASIPNIKQAIDSPGKKRKEFDKLQNEIATHLTKKHQFYPPWHFTYRIGLSYFVCGIILGLIADWFHSQYNLWVFTVTAGVLGLFAGNLIGSKKDAEIKRNGKRM